MPPSNRMDAARAALFTTAFSVLAGLILPAVFVALSIGNLKGVMETESEINADLVSRVVTTHPELWRFETTRLEELLARRGRSRTPEIRRLYDQKGVLVCESAIPLLFPTLRISRPVMDEGGMVGRIEIVRSILPVVLVSLLLSLAGLAAALLLRRFLPFQALIEAHDFLGEVMEACTNAIVVLDPEGRIRFFNGRFRTLADRSTEELRGLPLAGFFEGEPRSMVEGGLRDVADGRIGKAGFETLLCSAAGTPRNLLFDAVPLSGAGGARGVVVSLLDITERRAIETEMRLREEQVQRAQKMQSLGSLAGGVAHDMNNVLAAILGLATVHLHIQPEGSAAHKAFSTIAMAAERGGKVVKSLLGFARNTPAEERSLDLNALLREQAGLLELTTQSRVRLEMDLADDLLPMLGDAHAVTTALMNLCSNAMDAMEEQGRLTLRTRNGENGWIEVQVEDNGRGMTRQVLEQAMDPFFTTKETGKGAGLGLSMVFSTVRAHKGQIDIQSEPGRGTRVRLRFPALGAGDPPPLNQSAEPGKGLNVLLVDDDQLIQTTLNMILRMRGHGVQGVDSGEAALARIEEGFLPDVVILDLNMPGLGGAGTLPRIRTLLPRVPVLLATGRADQAAMDLAAAHAGVTLLAKPFSAEDLEGAFARMGLGVPSGDPPT